MINIRKALFRDCHGHHLLFDELFAAFVGALLYNKGIKTIRRVSKIEMGASYGLHKHLIDRAEP